MTVMTLAMEEVLSLFVNNVNIMADVTWTQNSKSRKDDETVTKQKAKQKSITDSVLHVYRGTQ